MRLLFSCAAVIGLVAANCPMSGAEGDAPCPFAVEEVHRLKKLGSPDPLTTTYQGCECESECSASIDFGLANCDWCYTKDGCGHFSLTRLSHYDYCVYPEDKSYESQSAADKTAYIMKKVYEDQQHADYVSALGIAAESIQTSFDCQWDVMPAGRKKYIHGVGNVCEVDFEITSDKYTGVLSQGTHRAILRMGSAAEPSSKGIIPGYGIKIMRDGVMSANWVMLHALGPQESFNFFEPTLWNHIPPPSGPLVILAKKFNQASNCITKVGLSDAASYDTKGNHVSNPQFPYRMGWQPTGNFNIPSESQSVDEMVANIAEMPVGTHLFNIYGLAHPAGEDEVIGKITTRSKCTGSNFGDTKLFFKHQRVEEDWELRPEWLDYIDAEAECGVSSVGTVPPADCSQEDLTAQVATSTPVKPNDL